MIKQLVERGSLKKLAPIVLFAILSMPTLVLAADSPAEWRPTYDLIMMWVNFGILVFLLVKLTKTPIIKFFRGQKEELEEELHEAEEQHRVAQEKVAKTQKLLDESEVRLKQLRERILKQGEQKKQAIIDSAMQESRTLLDDARRRVDSQIIQARQKFKAELIDAAIEEAMAKIPSHLTEDDDRQMIDNYIQKVG